MCKDAVRWVYELPGDHSWSSGFLFDEDYAFKDKAGVTRLLIARDGTMTVTAGYAWDGCTPKICIFDLLVGTPDGVVHAGTRKPKTYYASLVHDALYQFVPDGLPISKHQADVCFLRLMEETGFAPRHLYYAAVVVFGGLFRRYLRRVRGTKGSRHVVPAGSRAALETA